jgi:predicted N-formylglutamate amidohydrolase
VPATLLAPDEPDPVIRVNFAGGSPFFLTGDHAGLRIPRALGDLGVSESERRRHIGWDIGIEGVGRQLSELLDAALIMQVYSRLVIDCNRQPRVPTSIPEISETTRIPGNHGLTDADREAREHAIFWPYQNAVADALAARAANRQRSIFIALHSFTPEFAGVSRPWHAGVLFNRDDRLAAPLLRLLEAEGDLTAAANEPYRMNDLTDYTVPVHAEKPGLLHVELEIRQDLIAEPDGQRAWAERLARLLPAALEKAPA